MLVCLALVGCLAVVTGDFYSSRYDNFDIEPLLNNDRVLMSYAKCFLDEGPCTPDAKDFKKVIPESLETTCGKCTLKQKDLIRKVVRAVMERHPDCWSRLVDKYDPENKYRDAFNQFVEGSD